MEGEILKAEGNSESKLKAWEVIVVGGGCAGLSAAVYLARAKRQVLVIDSGQSLALWEPDVQNYFGFPEGIAGPELLERGQKHAEKYGAKIIRDEVCQADRDENGFLLKGKTSSYRCRRLLLATGVLHIPPDIPHVNECLGHSMFFCKDCDGHRSQQKQILIVGSNNDAVEYALGMMFYSSSVFIATNGRKPKWGSSHANWISEYEVPVFEERIRSVEQQNGLISSVTFEGSQCLAIDALFTTRGDIVHNRLAKRLGAELDPEGQVVVDHCMRTSVEGLYAAGCVTPANCQMIIAAGDGAVAAQAINRDLFEESLCNHALRRFRAEQINRNETGPVELGVA